MESFELALAHILVQREGYTWFPPGALFPELALFRSKGSRGTLLRLVRADETLSLSALADSSFLEAKEILVDHSFQGITVVQLVIYSSEIDATTLKNLKKLEKHEMAPSIAVYTAWFNLESQSYDSNIPWFAKGTLPETIILEAARACEDLQDPAEMQQEIIFTIEQRRSEWKNVFVQSSSKAVTSLLVIIIGMFLWMMTQGPAGSLPLLKHFGAKFNDLIIAGEYWRLLTPIFLHVSYLHLLVNAMALYSLREAEWIFGSNRFLIIFLLAGITGNIASFAFSPYPAAGASGSLFGIMGALLYFGTQRKEFFRRTMGSAVWTTLAINLVLGFLIPQISNSAHIGGLIGGFLAAAAIGLPNQKWKLRQLFPAVFLLFLSVGGVYLGYQ